MGLLAIGIMRHVYAYGSLFLCILQPHYLGMLWEFGLKVLSIYAAPVVFVLSFLRECLCVLHLLLDENNICHLKKNRKLYCFE